jgi:hypothetical protein
MALSSKQVIKLSAAVHALWGDRMNNLTRRIHPSKPRACLNTETPDRPNAIRSTHLPEFICISTASAISVDAINIGETQYTRDFSSVFFTTTGTGLPARWGTPPVTQGVQSIGTLFANFCH